MLNSYLVELHEAFALGNAIVDEDSINILHVRETDDHFGLPVI